MLFARLFFATIPFLSLATAHPISGNHEIIKRATPLEVVQTLQASVAEPVAALKSANAAGTLTEDDAATYLTAIQQAIDVASAQAPSTAVGVRSLSIEERQADDLEIVGEVLAEIIKDILDAVDGIVDELKNLPLVGAIITSIDGGLNTLLLGLQLVLAGVVQILQGLLAGLSGLLLTLGNGLLAGLIFG